MPTRASKTAEDVADTVADTVKSLIDRVVDAELTKEIARRGQDVAGVLADRGADVAERAGDAWRETKPARRDAAKRVAHVTGEAAKRSDTIWSGALVPVFRDLWQRRTVAAGAAGAAVPAGRELLDAAAVRLGLKEREREEERRRWGAFFLGMILGAAAGAIVAMLTTPRRGSDVRRELGARADEVRREIGARADDLATKARDADWMPVFQREDDGGNGHATAATVAKPTTRSAAPATPRKATTPKKPRASRTTLQSAAADSGSGAATGDAADRAASDTAGAINEAYDVDREPTR
jgi:gas vesicle protein